MHRFITFFYVFSILGQTRDWNEELQTTRELSRKNLPERLLRERAVFKVHSDFVSAATRGAIAVIDGNVMAINPGEDPKMQMFIWNNIFFSLGFDVRDHYKVTIQLLLTTQCTVRSELEAGIVSRKFREIKVNDLRKLILLSYEFR